MKLCTLSALAIFCILLLNACTPKQGFDWDTAISRETQKLETQRREQENLTRSTER